MLDYKSMKLDDIIKWCKDNNREDAIAWLKEMAATKVEYDFYPRVDVINAKGKKVKKADKTQQPVKKLCNISYVDLKTAFVEKFMPEIAPNKEKPASMIDKIMAL